MVDLSGVEVRVRDDIEHLIVVDGTLEWVAQWVTITVLVSGTNFGIVVLVVGICWERIGSQSRRTGIQNHHKYL